MANLPKKPIRPTYIPHVKKRTLISLVHGRQDALKPAYRESDVTKDAHALFAAEIYLIPQEPRVQIVVRNWAAVMQYGPFGKIPEKVRKRIVKRLNKSFTSSKPVDTSKWVHPDKESIARELVTQCCERQLWLPESEQGKEARAKMDILYSILQSHSPRNPQSLTNFANPRSECPLEIALEFLGSTEAGMVWRLQDKTRVRGKFDFDTYFVASWTYSYKLVRRVVKLDFKGPALKWKAMMRRSDEASKAEQATPEAQKKLAEWRKNWAKEGKDGEKRRDRLEIIKDGLEQKYQVKPWQPKR